MRVLIDPVADISILYGKAFEEMGLLSSMLNPPHSALKPFNNDLSVAFGTIRLPIKTGNEDDDYINSKETFFVVDAPSRYDAVMSIEWQHIT